MIIVGYDLLNLKKHKVTERECVQALADPFKLEVHSGVSKNGNPTSLWVGSTLTDRILEIGVEYLEEMDWIFHANIARSEYISKYRENTR